jgi:transcriptional regulator with XRE-family HTH domain
MEKTFRRMKDRLSARHAYVEAEVVTSLAHQIKAIRLQRGWTQKELAKLMGSTQAVISRLEDPSYGRYTVKTLLELSKVFDSGLKVQFVSLVSMLNDTFVPRVSERQVEAFEDEAQNVGFFELSSPASYSVLQVSEALGANTVMQALPAATFSTGSAVRFPASSTQVFHSFFEESI